MAACTSFGWGAVYVHHSNVAMFWICDENSILTNGMVVVEHRLHSINAFSASPAALPARGLRGTQPAELPYTDHRNIPYHTASCSIMKMEERRKVLGRGGCCTGWDSNMAFIFPSNCYT